MQILLSWLKEYIAIDDLSPTQLAEHLTLAGLEVDSVETIGPPFQGVIVAQVTDAQPHPNAEKLQVATVTDGVNSWQVVCGAPNCRAGLVTALAQVGATVLDKEKKPVKIKKGKLRGVESLGMLCSPEELGLFNETSGQIIELNPHLPLGKDLLSLYSDAILQISLTPNLNHAASVIGIARELSAILDRPFQQPVIHFKEDGSSSIEQRVNVTLHPFAPRYACRLLEDVRVGPSPKWLFDRIERSGLRSVNNVVDITNYVLLELGQPLHAFDAAYVHGPIRVALAEEGALFCTLDGKDRTLSAHNLMICDAQGYLAIAGVMGGSESQVSQKTTTVLLEAAYFTPEAIRKSSKTLGLSTDASKRFERGSDPGAVLQALNRATMLIQELCHAKVVPGALDVHTRPFTAKTIPCRIERINTLLGTELSFSEVEALLQRLQCQVTWESQEALHVKVPTYRTDLNAEIDLVEEVARLWGFHNLPRKMPLYRNQANSHLPFYTFEKRVRTLLLRLGLQEMLTCDLIGPQSLKFLDQELIEKGVVARVQNANVVEHSFLRPSLLPGLLEVAKHNNNQQCEHLAGFEIGHVYQSTQEVKNCPWIEQVHLGLLLMGRREGPHWNRTATSFDFYDLKGIVETFLEGLHAECSLEKSEQHTYLHPGQQMQLRWGKEVIGAFGQLHPKLMRLSSVDLPLFFAEFNLTTLMRTVRGLPVAKPLPLFPASLRDLTLTLPERCTSDNVIRWVKKQRPAILEDVWIWALYRSEKLGPDHKNLTLRFSYRHPQKTLSYEEIQSSHLQLVEKLEQLAQGERV